MATAGVGGVAGSVGRQLRRRSSDLLGVSFKTWAGQFTFYAMFFHIPILMVAIAIAAMPSNFGWQTWAITGTTLTIQLALLLGLSRAKILRWTNLVQPAPANFRDLALREAERAGAKLRQVWIDRSPAATRSRYSR